MSTRTEHSAWSPDEADSLENIDKEIQLVSTSTESHSASNKTGSEGHKKLISDFSLKSDTAPRQSDLNIFHSKSYDNLQAIKCQVPCDDFFSKGKKSSFKLGKKNSGDSSNHTYNLLNNYSAKKASTDRSDLIVEHTINNSTPKLKEIPSKNLVLSETSNKQDYLEQINKQLKKELDEKNAILSLLQENYERLLFKYAEAKNKIDELRIKFVADKTEPKHFQTQNEILNNHIQNYYNAEYSKITDTKCQKAVVAPFINLDEPHSPSNENLVSTFSRPTLLPLENNVKFGERDLLKATTPTDSEGLSSIITSMSGHSKILNSLVEENQLNKKPSFLKCEKNNFSLQENAVNDPFDKVKNWQNSLPPLEQIETPETTLYNINNAYSSTDTNYKDISSPKMKNKYVFSDESCPLSWREELSTYKPRFDVKRNKVSSQVASVKESEFYSKKPQNHTFERDQFYENNLPLKEKSPSQSNIPSTCIFKKRENRAPLLRCSSLPAYDYESIRSENCKNGIYIPPLDLNNVTLSDDESYCQQNYYISKSNPATSSSFISSREDSVDRSVQISQSFSSCKVTISEERIPKQTVSKSTSITPDRNGTMNLSFTIRDKPKFDVTSPTFLKGCNECSNDKSLSRCNVCGESLPNDKSNRFFGSRSNSCESVHKKNIMPKETSAIHLKPPFKRSVSFGSGTSTYRYCSHEKLTTTGYFLGLNEDSLENFDAYASNLKARSEVVIKALTAHVNNS